jgi:hypothetical protein
LAFALVAGVFAHGHQGTQTFGKDGFVAKSVHGLKHAANQLKRNKEYCFYWLS